MNRIRRTLAFLLASAALISSLTLASAQPLDASAIAKLEATLPESQREGLRFLLENMPPQDRLNLSPALLGENVSLAYEAIEQAPWGKSIPKDVFLNDVLPYVCVNEKRDNWRKQIRSMSQSLVKDCKTPSEAAQKLNQELFKLVNVKYSTARKKADQSALETMESGLASCTGLSILLADACRSVGVPARIVGTPMWINMRGNHTWVEIWDGDWHFTGAAEPDPSGLDKGWFQHDASQARRDTPKHAIYASSFRKTGLSFPMVWAQEINWVSAVNVTDRYTPTVAPVNTDRTRLLIKVLDAPAGKRVAAQVYLTDPAEPEFKRDGTSRDERVDMNDILPFEVPHDHTFMVRVESGKQQVTQLVKVGKDAQQVHVVALNEFSAGGKSGNYCVLPARLSHRLKSEVEAQLKQSISDYLNTPTASQGAFKFPRKLQRLLEDHESEVRRIAWETYATHPMHNGLHKDFEERLVRFQEHQSPYTIKTVGARPAKGWPLFIAMHGGGGTTQEFNDSQWRRMQNYYKDHPELGGYLYVALRAPNNTWNGFYDVYVYPLIENLIRQFRLYGGIDPNKVFIMGYSHGGYGAFAIGPKMPDHFAAIHSSAAAPTEGETVAKTLRTTPFTFMVGELDTDHGRYERDQRFIKEIEQLRGSRTDIYPVSLKVIPNHPHSGLPDRDKIVEMYGAQRDPVPNEISWLMSDNVIRDFFWLHTDAPAKQSEIDAELKDNQLTITTTNVSSASAYLDTRLIDFKKPLQLSVNGKTTRVKLKPSLEILCKTLTQRGDPELVFTAEVPLAGK